MTVLTVTDIQKAVARAAELDPATLASCVRTQRVAYPRMLAMSLSRRLIKVSGRPVSFPAIGARFGGRDHTTAMHACRTWPKLTAVHADLAHLEARVLAELEARP